jgi:hypothetical protein
VAEHAVHFWSGSANTLVERNLIIDCDRGIGFGLGSRGHENGIIRNNMISHRDLGGDYGDVAIELESSSGTLILHNSVYLSHAAPGGIAVRFAASSGVQVMNNVIHVAGGAPAVWLRDGASVTASNNVTTATADWFADADGGDLHLANTSIAELVDAATPAGSVPDDYDGTPRPVGGGSDIGADEVGGAAALLGLSWGALKSRYRP